jgi:hypothetical protein
MRRMRVNTSWPLVAVFLLLFPVAMPCAAFAQSGRRAPKGSPAPPPPTPAQTETTPPVQAKSPAQPQISIIVVSDISQSLYLSIPFPEKVQTWVAKRLRDSASLAVIEGERANRSEAVKRAKASTDTFVIFLRVDETGNNTANSGRANIDDVSIGYYVFAPVTGKSQSSGMVYLNQRSTIIGIGRTGVPPSCYPGVRGNDLYLLQASLEVANRIMSVLHVAASPPCS